jgi:hypothetical protein
MTLQAIVGPVKEFCEKKDINVVFGKYAGGASMTQSPNDNGKGLHVIIHQQFNSSEFKYESTYPMPPGDRWKELDTFLKDKLQPKDHKTLMKALKHAPRILAKACEPSHVIGAFHDTGIATREGVKRVQEGLTRDPSDPLTILSKCPDFRKFTGDESERLLTQVLPRISEKYRERGFALESKHK